MSQTQTRRSSQVDLLHGPILKSLLLFALPIMASRVFQQIYNTMDTLIVGYTLGDSSIAAMGACSSIYEMMTGFTFGVGNGLAIVTARCFGRQETDRMKKSVASCIVIGVAVTLVVTILATIFMHPLLRLLKTPAEILEESYSYISILSIFLFVMFAYNLCSGLLRAIGNSFMPLVFLIFSSLVNIVLDLLFIRTFGMGVRGAAIATVIGNILSAVFYVSHLLSKKSQLSIRLQDYKAGDKIAGSVFAIGIPASLNSVLMSVSNIFINNLMAHYGDMAVAGLGVAMKVNMIVVMLLIGLGTGIQPLLGYCFGAGNRKRYFAVLKFSILLAFVLSAIMTCVCYFGADGLVSAFLEDADAYDFGFQFSRIYILSGPILGQLFVFINAIQSTGAALPSLILSISRQGLLYLPILFIINATTDSARLLALAQPVTDYLATALAIILFVITCKKYFPKKSSIE